MTSCMHKKHSDSAGLQKKEKREKERQKMNFKKTQTQKKSSSEKKQICPKQIFNVMYWIINLNY